ncbi:MAG: SusC/RagA family TonB-linked outer membrane protein, partial [Bacteroidales bacterium]|nr:SusC/RagA family TonB-linked outer membrane protein [Bacteroidales bacterium]
MKNKLLLSIVCLFLGTALTAQTITISGRVLAGGDKSPVIEASVQAEGTKLGTTTDVDGKFTLSGIPATVKRIKISCINMKTITVPIKKQMTIYMEDDSEKLDEVMVVAYGTAKKSSYAGSAALVKSDAIKDLPNTSFENALNGKVAGLQITTTSGQAGSLPSIRIRGNGSMNASNEPLYIVDGVPVFSGDAGQMSNYTCTSNNMLNTINPEDIESISVLKDAAASSLYGSRAANGVILITTKSGREGKPVVNLKISVGFTPTWATDNYEPAGINQQVDMLYTIFHNYRTVKKGDTDAQASIWAVNKLKSKFNMHGYTFSSDDTGAYAKVKISEYDDSGRGGKYFDWDKAYFRTAVYQTYDFSVSGATSKTNYYASLSYTDNQGRLKVNNFDRASGLVNLNQKVGKLFEFRTRISLAKTEKCGYNDTRNTGSNYFMQTRNLLWGMYWPTNYKTGEPWTARYGSYAQNGVYYDKQWDNNSSNINNSIAETVTLHLLSGLNVRSILSYDNSTVKDHLYYSAKHFKGASTNGSVTEMRTTYEKTVSSTTANYNKSFGLHNFAVLAGFEAEKNKNNFIRSTGEDLPTSKLHTVSTAGTHFSAGYDWGNSMLSVLSKFDYNYDQKYFASFSFRRDGSSKLSPDTRWGNFWSVAGAWRISEEHFFKNHPTISNLRLRASYGINGTLPTDNYGYINLMTYENSYMGNPGGTITTLANNNLTWETSYTTNLGIDIGLFNNRLYGTLEYFNRNSKDLLQDVPISRITGFTSTLENIGEINNKGIELEVGGDIIKNKNFTWSASGNISFIKSKVTKLYDGSDIIWYDPTGGDHRAQFIYREGESTLAFYGYQWAGVDKTNGKSVYYVNDPNDPKSGDFLYNGRGATYDYHNANYKIIGNAMPLARGGFSSDMSFRGLDISLNFIYKIGGKLYDGAYKDVADDGYYW